MPARVGPLADADLQAALEARVAAGAPGALACIEVPESGLSWTAAAGRLARGNGRALRPDDAFRAASVTKTVTAAAAVRLAEDGRLGLDAPLADQLNPALLRRWRAFDQLPRTTPRQLLGHTAGLPDYFRDEAFAARMREEPSRVWLPAELVDHAAAHGVPQFAPGEGFGYSDTGFVVAGILIEQITGRPLHAVYRELVFDPLAMDSTWLEGSEPARRREVAHHYSGEIDLTTISPTVDWAAGGLVTSGADLTRFGRGLWSEQIVDADGLEQLTRWTPGPPFPPGHAVRYDDYGLGMGRIVVAGVELIGHTGFIGAFAFHAPDYNAVLAGTHNDASVDRWPLVSALCRELASPRPSVTSGGNER
ncbi:MAG: serine hydrolase domain-containing protein [Solirubrobacterales bacterium]